MTSHAQNRDSIIFKSSLLSSTFLITGASATNSMMPSLRAAFPSVSKQLIQSFFSWTALPQFIMLVLAGFIASRIGKRNTILLGVGLWTIAGLLPMVLTNFYAILVTRIFLGASLGLIQPIGTSMIADYYEGDTRNKLLGIQSAVIGISGTILTYLLGILIGINWRDGFLIYLVGIIAFVMTLVFLPNDRPQQQKVAAKKTTPAGSKQLGRDVIWWICLTLFFNLGQGGINIDFNLAVVEEHIANATGAANMMVAYSVLGLITGIFFGYYMKFAKSYGGVIAALLFLIGNGMVAICHSIPTYYIAMCCAGAGFGLFMPYMFAAVNAHTTAANSAYATSATTAAASFANFLAPYIYGFLAKLCGNTSSRFAFWFSATFSLLLLIGLLILHHIENKEGDQQNVKTA